MICVCHGYLYRCVLVFISNIFFAFENPNIQSFAGLINILCRITIFVKIGVRIVDFPLRLHFCM